MSKSTPLSQLPSVPEEDSATQEINSVINEYLPPQQQYNPQYVAPQMQQQAMVQQQQLQQQSMQPQPIMMAPAAPSILTRLGINEAINIKLVVICTVLFVVLSHVKVTSLIAMKFPFIAKNPIVEVVCRALLFAVLVVFAQSLFV